jgi:folate-binding protein YgfZ
MAVQALAGYDAAVHGLAIATRPDRARVRVTGRDPVKMLEGVITNRIPEPPRSDGTEVTRGHALYAAVLTPKGKMVADLRVVRGPRSDEEGLLLDVPAAALGGLLGHLGRYLPPRLARTADASAGTAQLTVAGPRAADWLTRDALGLRIEASELRALAENEWVWMDAGGPGVLVIRSAELDTPSFDVVADADTAEALVQRARAVDGAGLTPAELDVLRIEAGRPAWDADLGEDTLPPEAGIDGRAIDHTKGCYTGQEVIVRIRDRGHVNRRLRGIRLGAAPLPARGTELWSEGRDRPVGAITSAAASPRAGEGLALGYVRREVEAPGEVRLGSAEGPVVRVVELGEGWWRG